MDGNDFEQITPLSSASFTWLQIPRFYDLGEGKHRLTLEFPNSNILLDQVALTTGSEDLESYKKDAGYCSPPALKWGLDASDIISFYEAEAASTGIDWSINTSANAKGGAYVSSEATVTSPEIPEGNDKVITFTVSVDKSDEYDVWAKIQALGTTESSLWISVDNEPFKKWGNLGNATYEWYWKKFHYTYGSEQRSLTYFLEAGQHQVKIALASGNVSVDRLAIATRGKLPESVDPNILLLQEKLDFEAENATFLGTVTVQDCGTSSNGQQVLLGNVNTNGVRFSEIVAETAGPYKLKVSYMSKVSRYFRLIVNGTIMGRQTVAASGNWCYEGGSPAIYEVVVILKRGLNTIDITPFSSDAPIIDKIQLEKAELNGLSLEAELAELVGTNTIVSCATASNSALVNMGTTANNGVRYKDLISSETKAYHVDVYYISKVTRNLKVSVNSQPFVTQSYTASGNWCYEGGTTKVQTFDVDFVQGSNSIEFRPTGVDAPFIDKIVIRDPSLDVKNSTDVQQAVGVNLSTRPIDQAATNGFAIYPNPVQAGAPITLSIHDGTFAKGNVYLKITDITSRVVFSQNLTQKGNVQFKPGKSLSKGMYIFTVTQGAIRTSKKIIVQ
jgi:hypothetical protein